MCRITLCNNYVIRRSVRNTGCNISPSVAENVNSRDVNARNVYVIVINVASSCANKYTDMINLVSVKRSGSGLQLLVQNLTMFQLAG